MLASTISRPNHMRTNFPRCHCSRHHDDGPSPLHSEKMRFARLFCGLLFFTTKLHVRPLQKLVALKLAALVFFVSTGGPVIRLPPRDTTKEGVAGVQGQWKQSSHEDILGILEHDDSVLIML
ncbi:hypothetical protein PG985_009200 [Apiospora marii]|uniref:uncharacterized protein n=1 Tax=Apiospora marii TaxID=335849 RepID=UPI0031314469